MERRRRRARKKPAVAGIFLMSHFLLLLFLSFFWPTQHDASFFASADKIIVKRAQPKDIKEANSNTSSDKSKEDDGAGKIVHADEIDDSLFDPVEPDPSCLTSKDGEQSENCDDTDNGSTPPFSTIETEKVLVIDATCAYGGVDPSTIDPDYDGAESDELNMEAESAARLVSGDGPSEQKESFASRMEGQCIEPKVREVIRDKHWGSDAKILKMRDRLRMADVDKTTGQSGGRDKKRKRPPIFLLPGLAATRLVSWRHTSCKSLSKMLSDIKMQDYVWLNMNLLLQMATIDSDCWVGCLSLGLNQSDPILRPRGSDKESNTTGGINSIDSTMRCKLRPDEGLDAISSLAPGSVTSDFLVGGTNTVYAWLTQWLADNLGYDVTSLLGLPYDWRLSPDVMEERDGFLTSTRRRIEAAVKTNGAPGIMVAHSMGNVIFRYFLEWLRLQMRKEVLSELMERWERRKERERRQQKPSGGGGTGKKTPGWLGGAAAGNTKAEKEEPQSVPESIIAFASTITTGVASGLDGLMKTYFEDYMPSADGEDNAQSDGKSTTATTKDKAKQGAQDTDEVQLAQLVELSKIEGDQKWLKWLHEHIWTYVGLSAPLLGAVNPLRAVLSGENMGLPMTEDDARRLELSFGSTNNVVPISTKLGFCDATDGLAGADRTKLACLEELIPEIEQAAKKKGRGKAGKKHDPWKAFPALKHLLKDRVDWDTNFPMIQASLERCTPEEQADKAKENRPCNNRSAINFSARDAPDGFILEQFARIWNEKNVPLLVKRDQLLKSYWHGPVGNILNTTWDRPHIKHVIMAYGVDVPTEVGYVYGKTEIIEESEGTEEKQQYDEIPKVRSVVWEEENGNLVEQITDDSTPVRVFEKIGLSKKKPTRRPVNGTKLLGHAGDGTIPYLSLSWAHTWLLHATRAMRHSSGGHNENGSSRGGDEDGMRITDKHVLDKISISHRPKGGSEWIAGAAPEEKEGDETCIAGKDGEDLCDTGTAHPHGTKYKPSMIRYQSHGRSRSTGNEYTTAVIEAIGVEHKETTRNYDILAAVFTDVLLRMHDDFQLV